MKGLVPVAMLLVGRGRPRQHPKDTSDRNIMQLQVAHAHTPPFQCLTRADIAQLRVAYAHTQGNFGHYMWRFITWLLVKRPHYGGYCACAHPREPLRDPQGDTLRGHVTFGHFQLPWYLYYCTTFCTTTKCTCCAWARDHFRFGQGLLLMMSLPVTWLTSLLVVRAGHVTDVTSGHGRSRDFR